MKKTLKEELEAVGSADMLNIGEAARGQGRPSLISDAHAEEIKRVLQEDEDFGRAHSSNSVPAVIAQVTGVSTSQSTRSRFYKKNPDIVAKRSNGVCVQHKTAINKFTVYSHQQALTEIYSRFPKLTLEPGRILNLDETAVVAKDLVRNERVMVVRPREDTRSHSQSTPVRSVPPASPEVGHVTFVASVCADGTKGPNAFLVSGGKIKPEWLRSPMSGTSDHSPDGLDNCGLENAFVFSGKIFQTVALEKPVSNCSCGSAAVSNCGACNVGICQNSTCRWRVDPEDPRVFCSSCNGNLQTLVLDDDDARLAPNSSNDDKEEEECTVDDATVEEPEGVVVEAVDQDQTSSKNPSTKSNESLPGKDHTGCMNTQIFSLYLRQVILPFLRRKFPTGPLLLVYDAPKAHGIPYDVLVELLREFQVDEDLGGEVCIYCLPHNSSLTTQPLDVSCFGSLKRRMRQAIRNCISASSNPGVRLNPTDICSPVLSVHHTSLSILDRSLPREVDSLLAIDRTLGLMPFTMRMSVSSLLKIALYCWNRVPTTVVSQSFATTGIFPYKKDLFFKHWEVMDPRQSLAENILNKVSHSGFFCLVQC